jgi:hypothetical protein
MFPAYKPGPLLIPKFVCLQVKCGSLSLNNRLPADYQQRGDFFKRIIEISGFIDGIIPP